jgi:hypothetical protein
VPRSDRSTCCPLIRPCTLQQVDDKSGPAVSPVRHPSSLSQIPLRSYNISPLYSINVPE